MKHISLPSPRPGSSPAHETAVYESWACAHYGVSDPRQAWRKIVGEQPSLATLRAAMKEHVALCTVMRAYRPVQAAPAPTRPAISPVAQQWEAEIVVRLARGLTRSQAIVDIGKTDRALYEAYR